MSIFNKNIFLQNLNHLRIVAGKNKADFSEMLGVQNAFRKDYNSIGPKLLMGLQQHFNGVDENWLNAEHKINNLNVTLKKQLNYHQPDEHMLPSDKGGETLPGSFGIPELGDHQVKAIMAALTPEEMNLVEAIRELDPVNKVGLFSLAIHRLNEALAEKEVKKDKRKKKLFETAIKNLSKAIGDST